RELTMATTISYNLRSPAVKRLLQEARELQQDQCCDYTAQPLEDNLFEWHFVIRGPDGTEFEGGRYHGRILLPSEYPFKPPNLMLMTPNGRFELNKKICLSITGFHPEHWLPAWGIRTVLLGLIGFLTTKANGAIGGIDYTESERKMLALKSRDWKCPTCDISNIDKLPDNLDNADQSLTCNNKSKVNDIPQFSFVYDDERRTNTANSSKSPKDSDNKEKNSGTFSEFSGSEVVKQSKNIVGEQSSISRDIASTPSQQSSRSPRSIIIIDIMITILVTIVIALVTKKFL
ncbi:17837_t:CDS:2, partial [Acaulospora morrowiae]